MKRRDLIVSSLAGIAGLSATSVNAATRCGPIGCTSAINFRRFAARYEPQYQSQWCWAACIAMVFAHYGHRVSQARIVADAYGAPANIPAVSGFVIAQALNRIWIDDDGNEFEASLEAVFDAQAGINAIDNTAIIDAIDGGDPIIVGARGHAVVMTSVSYARTPIGPNVVQVGVFDPWPGRGARLLAPDEMTPVPMGSLMFLAQTSIS